MNSTTRTTDSNGYFIESKAMPVVATIAPTSIADEKRNKKRLQAIIDASNRLRIKRAKPMKYNKRALQAITYLLGDEYRDSRTLQEKRLDNEYRACKTTEERIAYTDKQWELWGDSLLKDRETVQAMRVFLSDSPLWEETERGMIAR